MSVHVRFVRSSGCRAAKGGWAIRLGRTQIDIRTGVAIAVGVGNDQRVCGTRVSGVGARSAKRVASVPGSEQRHALFSACMLLRRGVVTQIGRDAGCWSRSTSVGGRGRRAGELYGQGLEDTLVLHIAEPYESTPTRVRSEAKLAAGSQARTKSENPAISRALRASSPLCPRPSRWGLQMRDGAADGAPGSRAEVNAMRAEEHVERETHCQPDAANGNEINSRGDAHASRRRSSARNAPCPSAEGRLGVSNCEETGTLDVREQRWALASRQTHPSKPDAGERGTGSVVSPELVPRRRWTVECSESAHGLLSTLLRSRAGSAKYEKQTIANVPAPDPSRFPLSTSRIRVGSCDKWHRPHGREAHGQSGRGSYTAPVVFYFCYTAPSCDRGQNMG
ncbi:hypothetical protein B0H17DRAFT_1134116 [Mycena rosella]|uniref:Uncharacterized protein n=1 Tax=Mycena rosella TaxID=1033263 RepID=A0AAD7DG78_MYCRO|nr:hypothetical protein B0H17DRAFT_1134116 [Mycena rosella]